MRPGAQRRRPLLAGDSRVGARLVLLSELPGKVLWSRLLGALGTGMPQFPSWWRQMSALILLGLTIVVPLSGYFTQTHARWVTAGLLSALVLITVPPMFQWLFPPIKVRVGRPPALDGLRGLGTRLQKRLHRSAPHVSVAPE